MINNYNQSKYIRQEIQSAQILKNLIQNKEQSLKQINIKINTVAGPQTCHYDQIAKNYNHVQVSSIVNSLLSDANQLEKELRCLKSHLTMVDYYYSSLLNSCIQTDREIVEHYFCKDMKQVDIELKYCITNINRYVLQLIDDADINLIKMSN